MTKQEKEKTVATKNTEAPQNDQPATGVPQDTPMGTKAPQGDKPVESSVEQPVEQPIDDKVKQPIDDKVEQPIDKPAGKKRIRYSFPTVSRCPRCRTTDTVATSTQGKIQYRRCLRAICRWTYQVIGKKV